MKLSDRITGLTGGGSDGWDIYRKARRLKAEGVPVVELTIGEHDIGTDQSILDAMYAAAKGGHTGYAAVPGTGALRDAVAERVQERTGIITTRDNVIVTPGGQAALFAAHIAVCDPGDTALFIDPFYATYPGTIRAAGAVATPVKVSPNRGFQPDRQELVDACPARSLLINSPNNPTGVVYGRETLNKIAAVAQEQDLWLISDEVYDTMIWDGEHISLRTLPEMTRRTLVIGSLSKSHAMTGSRLGWIVGPAEAIDNLSNLATHTNYGIPGYIQDAGVFALSQGPALEETVAAPFRRRHAAICAFLAARGIPFVPSAASMYLMADIRQTGLSGDAFAERLLEDYRIAVMPGESFGEAAAGHLRIALTVEDDVLLSAINCLAGFYANLISEAA